MLKWFLLLASLTGLPRLVTRLVLDGRVPFGLKLILPAALVYLIWPRDIVPDMLPPLGQVDDILVVLVALVLFLALAPKDIVAEHLRRPRKGSDTLVPASEAQQKVIEGSYRVVDEGEP